MTLAPSWRPLATLARQRGLPRSMMLASQVKPESATQLSAPLPTIINVSILPLKRRCGDHIQAPAPPGTHFPVCPLVAVQVSCFTLVAAIQQFPDATGRPAFWRAKILASPATPAEAIAAKPRMMVAMVNCILNDLSGGLL
jgi:hypothetical protein